MLRDSDGVVRVIVVATNLFHLQVTQDSAEYHVEQLDTVGILHHTRVHNGHRGNRTISGPFHSNRNRL